MILNIAIQLVHVAQTKLVMFLLFRNIAIQLVHVAKTKLVMFLLFRTMIAANGEENSFLIKSW